jgi:hypothetical protein
LQTTDDVSFSFSFLIWPFDFLLVANPYRLVWQIHERNQRSGHETAPLPEEGDRRP